MYLSDQRSVSGSLFALLLTVFLLNRPPLSPFSSLFKLSKVLFIPAASALWLFPVGLAVSLFIPDFCDNDLVPDVFAVSLFDLDFWDCDLDFWTLSAGTSPNPSKDDNTHCVAFCNDIHAISSKSLSYLKITHSSRYGAFSALKNVVKKHR